MCEAKYVGTQRGALELQTPVGAITVPGSLPSGAAWGAVLCPRYKLRSE